jgi:hypothetical protein
MQINETGAMIGLWYFLIAGSPYTTFTQVGPFATQLACQNYQAAIRADFATLPIATTACFNSTARQ